VKKENVPSGKSDTTPPAARFSEGDNVQKNVGGGKDRFATLKLSDDDRLLMSLIRCSVISIRGGIQMEHRGPAARGATAILLDEKVTSSQMTMEGAENV